MAKKIQITLSEVFKKDLRIMAFLLGSWGVALLAVYITGDEKLVGLAPVLNYVAFRIEQELQKEGYREALRK